MLNTISKFRHFAIIFGVAILAVLFFKWRYLLPQSGYPSFGWDYGGHISVVNHLLNWNFFPEWFKGSTPYHTISNYLPIYHGIIGSHLLVVFFHFFGLGIPASMLLLSDLALILIFICMIQLTSFKKAFSLFIFFVFPAYALMTFQGFFSSTIASAFVFLFLYSLIKGKTSWLALEASVLCYPDPLIWMTGYLAALTFKDRKTNVKFYIYIIVFFFFLSLFIARSLIWGRIAFPLSYFLILGLTVLFCFTKDKELFRKPIALLSATYFLSAMIIILSQILLFFRLEADYYPLKYTYISLFFIVALWSIQKWPKWLYGLSFFLALASFAQFKDEYLKAVTSYLRSETFFSSQDEEKIKSLLTEQGCSSWVHIPAIFPKDPDLNLKNIVYEMIFYSYFDQYDLHESKVRSQLKTLAQYDSLRSFLKAIAYSDEADKNAKEIITELQATKGNYCIAVDHSRKQIIDSLSSIKQSSNEGFAVYVFH